MQCGACTHSSRNLPSAYRTQPPASMDVALEPWHVLAGGTAGKTSPAPFTKLSSPCTCDYRVQPYRVEYVNTSLWDLGNRFIERAQEVQHTHDEWGPVHGTLSDMDAYRYCMTNGPLSLYEGYIDAMHGMTRDAVKASNGVRT